MYLTDVLVTMASKLLLTRIWIWTYIQVIKFHYNS